MSRIPSPYPLHVGMGRLRNDLHTEGSPPLVGGDKGKGKMSLRVCLGTRNIMLLFSCGEKIAEETNNPQINADGAAADLKVGPLCSEKSKRLTFPI